MLCSKESTVINVFLYLMQKYSRGVLRHTQVVLMHRMSSTFYNCSSEEPSQVLMELRPMSSFLYWLILLIDADYPSKRARATCKGLL